MASVWSAFTDAQSHVVERKQRFSGRLIASRHGAIVPCDDEGD